MRWDSDQVFWLLFCLQWSSLQGSSSGSSQCSKAPRISYSTVVLSKVSHALKKSAWGTHNLLEHLYFIWTLNLLWLIIPLPISLSASAFFHHLTCLPTSFLPRHLCHLLPLPPLIAQHSTFIKKLFLTKFPIIHFFSILIYSLTCYTYTLLIHLTYVQSLIL